MRFWKSMIVFMMLLVIVSGCSQSESSANEDTEVATGEPPEDFTFGAATVGGLWHSLAASMSEEMRKIYPESTATVVEGGSIANLVGIHNDIFALGFSNGESIPMAENAVGDFEEPITNMKTIATFYPNVLHIVVPSSSNIHTVEDLAGQRVSPGIRGYSGEVMFKDILTAYDMSYDDLAQIEYIGTSDAADLMRDGHLDAWVGGLGIPASFIQELDTTLGVRVIPLTEEDQVKLKEINEGYNPYTIEAGTYGDHEDILTFAPETVLVANENMISEEVGYELTKMIIEKADTWRAVSSTLSDFDAEYSIEYSIGELHPGAKRYYEEIGVLND
ncbi:TAXI family TRAP transporter solute-binding subunit [Geomicrobium sp. JCM 19038]|uniref:TAXI family TRAP transporter solute-binding subunit n=1 Tax=Geomicrobium sp. JCM 19038 TaxID=1460635 RepID=UPI00045F2347|nr:TAXI family TRAP transporter solute-binding subunit [Geomicrobium sp. JCM 19038]GAK07921.1 TRAP transporter solute receptor, TAXI family precursor [Geomicrobium sp. JCM 19038]